MAALTSHLSAVLLGLEALQIGFCLICHLAKDRYRLRLGDNVGEVPTLVNPSAHTLHLVVGH